MLCELVRAVALESEFGAQMPGCRGTGAVAQDAEREAKAEGQEAEGQNEK